MSQRQQRFIDAWPEEFRQARGSSLATMLGQLRLREAVLNLPAYMARLVARCLGAMKRSAQRLRASPPTRDELDDADVDAMLSWHISCTLAALPNSYVHTSPPYVGTLIRRAKELHPEMAAGQDERERSGLSWTWDEEYGLGLADEIEDLRERDTRNRKARAGAADVP